MSTTLTSRLLDRVALGLDDLAVVAGVDDLIPAVGVDDLIVAAGVDDLIMAAGECAGDLFSGRTSGRGLATTTGIGKDAARAALALAFFVT